MNRQTLTPWLRRINSGVTTLASLIVVTTGAFVLYEATIGDRFLKPQDEIVYEESIAYTFQTYETAWEQIDAAFEDNQGQVNRWTESINHAIAYTDGVDAPAAYQDHKDRTLKELRKITKDSALAADLKEMLNALYELREAEDRREIAYSAYNESTLLNRLTRRLLRQKECVLGSGASLSRGDPTSRSRSLGQQVQLMLRARI